MEITRKITGRGKCPNLLLQLISTFILMCFPVSAPAAKDSILVIRIQGADFEQAMKGITQELNEEFLINEMIITRDTDIREIETRMARTAPKLLILMDNIAIKKYKKYQAALPPSPNPVPSLSLMASFTDIAIKGLDNAAGLLYEVPVVTSIVNLRSIMPGVNIRRVGVIYRDFLEESIRTNRMYCRKEHIDLISYRISDNKDMAEELGKGLEHLKNRIDALWVLNDSSLINVQLLRDVWFPFAQNFQKPVIAGAEILVLPKFQFGTFGVIPDHAELGVQAAQMIFNIMENNWQVSEKKVEQPGSVYKILNGDQAGRLFQVGPEQLTLVDKVLR